MSKTLNGRPAERGSMYFENNNGFTTRKYCVAYCDCGKKIGLTNEELKEFTNHISSGIGSFIARLAKAKILVP